MKLQGHKKRSVTLCDIYVILFVMYEMADIYIQTSLAALGTYIPMLLILAYYFYRVLFRMRTRGYLKMLVFFIFFLSIYGILHVIAGPNIANTKKTTFLLGNFYSLAPVLMFYVSSRNGEMSERKMKVLCLILLVVAIIVYANYFLLRDIDFSGAVASVTNNTSYRFVCLLPLLFLFQDKKIVQYSLLLIMLYFIMSAMKRGAILITALFLVFFFWQSINEGFSRRGVSKLLISIIIIVAFSYIVYRVAQQVWLDNDYFYIRLESVAEGDTNGRDDIYKSLWEYYTGDMNVFQSVFGTGADGTMSAIKHRAHNDWLELLIDCGIFGVIVYVVYFLNMFLDCRRYSRCIPESRILIACFIVLFVRSFFSMSFMAMDLGISAALGYSLAICESKYAS